MEYVLIFYAIIFLGNWLCKRYDKKLQEQLQQSEKYNRLCEMLKALQFYCAPITLTLNSLNEFRAYNKTVALDAAYSETCAKYKFFKDNHFGDKFYTIFALPYSDYEHVRQGKRNVSKYQ